MEIGKTFYARNREAWRRWLEKNHAKADEIWLLYAKKHTGKPRVAYTDAVDEALCFGWIDSILKTYDADLLAQRFTPRRHKSVLSPANRERIRRLIADGRMTEAGLSKVRHLLEKDDGASRKNGKPKLAPDVRDALKADPAAWKNFQKFPASYQRVRIGWIEGARQRPDVFQTRLRYFVAMTAKNKQYGFVR